MELKPITAENYRISVNYGRMAVDVDTPIKGYPSSFNIPYPFYVDGRKLSRARAVKYCLERLGYTTSK